MKCPYCGHMGDKAVDSVTSDDEKGADGKSTTDKAASSTVSVANPVLGGNGAPDTKPVLLTICPPPAAVLG